MLTIFASNKLLKFLITHYTYQMDSFIFVPRPHVVSP